MSRFEKRMLWGLGLLILALAILEAQAPKPTDWNPSFSRYHRTPYGGALVYDRLGDLFPEVRTVSETVFDHAQKRLAALDAAGTPVNHLYINSTFALDGTSAEELLAMVAKGDHVFIAAEDFQGELSEVLKVETRRAYRVADDTSDIRFIGDHRIAQGVFRYARNFPGAHFTRYDTSRTRILAVDGSSHPVLLEMAWSDGSLVLCSAPRAFTNYNLLKDRNATFMAGALSVLPANPVLWDEFYKVGRLENGSFVRFLLNQPALRWAWFTSLVLIALYMLIYARRQQRPIPVVVPPSNASRELAHTIGRLYWHKGDHADLARKMASHFKEEVRTHTYLRSFAYDEATVAHLATKTGLGKEEITSRLNAIQRREQAGTITEVDLLNLSNEIHFLRESIH